MLDELYDDVLSIMTEKGFVNWFHKKHPNKVSPLKWSYDSGCTIKPIPKTPKNLLWLGFTYETHNYTPIKLKITDTSVSTCD